MICRRNGAPTSRPTRITLTAVNFSATSIKEQGADVNLATALGAYEHTARNHSRKSSRGRTVRKARRQLGAVFCLRALLQDPRGPARCLQGSLQPEWIPVCALGLCRRHPMRPDREKTLLPCSSRGIGVQLRYAPLCSALRLL